VRRKLQKLSDDLERAILATILAGRAESTAVKVEELSKTGRAVLAAINALEKPTYAGVALHLTEVQAFPKESVQDYLSALQKISSEANATEVLQTVRDKQVLVELINAAQDMLSRKGNIDVPSLGSYLERDPVTGAHGLSTVAERVKDGFPPPPKGLALASLPSLVRQTGGIYGSWVIGGEPKLGKTALAWQIALDTSSTNDIPVLYYDLENSFAVMMDHTKSIYKGDLKRARQATSRLYHRDSIRSLEADLARVSAPALIVVDHIQRLSSSVQFAKASLDKWIHRLDALKKRGYTVLMVSEIARSQYNSDAYIGSFKESGEIEYAAETGIQLLRGSGETIEVHVVANRHRPFRGMASLLQRYNEWAFKEVGSEEEERPVD
jgi:hypothetical protein